MFTDIKRIIQSDRRLQLILMGGILIQLITAITAIGYSSADQHFQIIEFSLFQQGLDNGAKYVWEINHFVRPTLQVYLFTGYNKLCNAIGFTDPYAQLTVLRVILGLLMYTVFNLMAFHYFRNGPRKILVYVLLLMNFTWVLPYTRTLFCSEMMSSVAFFGTLLWYDAKKDKQPGFLFLLLIGFLFSLAFYFRFQIGFAMAGVGIWLLFFEKKYKHLLPIAIGFGVGFVLNVYLDYLFYKEWVLTPYTYFYTNIFDKRAAGFGESSFVRYIGLILGVMPAPLFCLVFFYYAIKSSVKLYRNPIYLGTVLFVIAHSMVGHKEERFIFPIFNVLPLIIGWTLPDLEYFYQHTRQWVRNFMKGLLWFTIVLNCFALVMMAFVPYGQTVQFSHLLKKKFDGQPVTVYSLGQHPFETPSASPQVFYKNGAPNITIRKFKDPDSIRVLTQKDTYFVSTYNEIIKHQALVDSMGFKPVMHSSDFLWGLNEFLHSKKMNSINEIWVLYKKE